MGANEEHWLFGMFPARVQRAQVLRDEEPAQVDHVRGTGVYEQAGPNVEEVERAARNLLAAESGPGTSTEIAVRATQACEQLVRHLSRLLGGTGSRTLFVRGLHLASASFPWFARAEVQEDAEDPSAGLRTRMESESPAVATEAFVCLLSTFVGLLARLIGDVLAARVLHEVWPAMFPSEVKETM